MKLKKTLGLSLAIAAVAASASFTPVANAEVSASAGVSNMYLWRGFDLGYGEGVVWGDLTYSTSGFHAGVWASSGDTFGGHEYDLIVGYGGEMGDFSYDLSVISYVYPSDVNDTDIGDFMEVVLSLGFGGFSFVYHDNIESEPGSYALGEEYSYFNLGYSFGDFGVAVGRHDPDFDVAGLGVDGDNPTHLDLTYNYNDNLSFTVSKMIADEENVEKDAHFAVSYSIAIE